MILRTVFSIALISILSGCASTSMRMERAERPVDSTKIGDIHVKVVELNSNNVTAIRPPVPRIPRELIGGGNVSYKVGASDVLVVTVWEHPELSQPLGQYRNDLAAGQLVDEAGYMYFPYVGRVKVAGMTLLEIQNMVAKSLSKVLKDPQVDVKVMAFRSQRVFVSGEVRNPGVVTIEDIPLTLPELIARVGGILPSGDASGIQLMRNGKGYLLDVDALLEVGAPLDSIHILPGDRVRIPAAEDRAAYVLGEVQRPMVLPLTNGRTSLLRGLTQAGGFDKLSSDAAGVYIVRAIDSARVTVFQLDGRSPVALAYAGQFHLKPKDLIYVDQSGLSRWNRVFQLLVPISNVLSTVTNSPTGTAVNLQNIKETW